MSRWDILLFAIASYMAIMALVNLMRQRRVNLENELQQQLERERAEAERRQAEQDRRALQDEQQKKFEDYIRRKQQEVA